MPLSPGLPLPANLTISRLSLGGATFGREIDAAAAHALIDHAVARGMTHIDTAAAYSAGESERIVGAWLASHESLRTSVTIATKVLPPYSPAALDSAVAASADRIGVQVIDLLYLHKWDPQVETTETLGALDRLLHCGRVRHIGASNFSGEQLRATLARQSALGLTRFQFIQNNNNLAVRDVDDALRALCRENGVGIVTYSPLGAGFLTGKHREGVQPGSRFDVIPGHQAIYFQPTAARRLENLAKLADQTGQTMSHLALVWALHQPGITSVLIGGRSLSHIDQAFTALNACDPALLTVLNGR